MKDEETVMITKKRLRQLEKAESFLNALEAAGVDNWGGYSDAHDMLEEWENNDEHTRP